MRLIPTAVAIAALLAAVPAFAADYPDMAPELRPSYSDDWTEGAQGPVRFEFGTRYWYSWGNQTAGFSSPFGDITLLERDNTHIGEVHAKIEDLSTQTYLKGIAGLGFSTSGTYTISPAGSGSIGPNSAIGYAGGDFGWLPLGQMDGGAAIGAFVGYHYWKDAPDIGSGQYVGALNAAGTPTSLLDAKDNFDIHALRLGIKAQAYLGDKLDVQAEVAAIPYAWVTGSLGGSGASPFEFASVPGVKIYERSPTTLSGHGYGAMGELMVGLHPTENLALRVGGRAWYVQGDLDAKFRGTTVVDATSPATIGTIDLDLKSNFARIFRYGALFELTGKF